MRLTLLHTNDIHGEVEGLARLATMVERIRAEAEHPVVYLDAGDVEETTSRLSNLTKGAAMHRLLSAAGCDVATVGNAAWLRYGAQVIAEHASVAAYPLLVANLRPIPGTQPSATIHAGETTIGVIGLTASFAQFLEGFDFGLEALDEAGVARELARALRADGADLVLVLSHLGLDVPQAAIDDRRLALELAGGVDLIIGAHSHDVLPEGEWIGGVLVAQAGSHASHLGRIELANGRQRASVAAISDDIPPHPRLLAVAEAIEPEIGSSLDEVIGTLPDDVGVAWIAEVLRDRMAADFGLAAAGQVLTRPLHPGPLRRAQLWDACDSPGNPGVVVMSGEQLLAVLAKGRDADFAATTPRPLRGRARGLLHVVGPDKIDAHRRYRVAATDWELGPLGGYVEAEWKLRPRYDFPTILREAIEEHLLQHPRLREPRPH